MRNEELNRALQQCVPAELRGRRLDQIAADLFNDYSRSRLQKWIRDGKLLVDGKPAAVTDRLVGGECLTLAPVASAEGEWRAQALALNVIFEDSAILVIDKPAGLVVHPGAGNMEHTLLNGLLHYCPQVRAIPRAGIVHRLDKDTTGLLVIAKTLPAHHALVEQLRARTVSRQYEAIVCGRVDRDGVISEPIGRHPVARTKMAVREGGKEAISHYRIVDTYPDHTHLRVSLETGRTHQIRVHLTHLGFPLVGDKVYGRRVRNSTALSTVAAAFPRQALHAGQLALVHPQTGKPVRWQAPLPADMQHLLNDLRAAGQAKVRGDLPDDSGR